MAAALLPLPWPERAPLPEAPPAGPELCGNGRLCCTMAVTLFFFAATDKRRNLASDYADAGQSARRSQKSQRHSAKSQRGSRAATIQRSSARSTPQARAAARLSIASRPTPLVSSSRTKVRGGWRKPAPVPSSRNSGKGSMARRSPSAAIVSSPGPGASSHASARTGVRSRPPGNTSSRTRKPRPAKPVTIGPCPASSRRSSMPVRLSVRVGPHRHAGLSVRRGRQCWSCSPCVQRSAAKGRA